MCLRANFTLTNTKFVYCKKSNSIALSRSFVSRIVYATANDVGLKRPTPINFSYLSIIFIFLRIFKLRWWWCGKERYLIFFSFCGFFFNGLFECIGIYCVLVNWWYVMFPSFLFHLIYYGFFLLTLCRPLEQFIGNFCFVEFIILIKNHVAVDNLNGCLAWMQQWVWPHMSS